MGEGAEVEKFFDRVRHTLAHLRDTGVDTDDKELISLFNVGPTSKVGIPASMFWEEPTR
jgi:hypothetical protein